MGAGNKVKGAVVVADVVQQDMQIQGLGITDPIVVVVGGEVVMPLPQIAIECRLNIDFYLLNIKLRPSNLLRRPNKSGMGAQGGRKEHSSDVAP